MTSSRKLHVLILALILASTGFAQTAEEVRQGYMSGEMIVRFQDDMIARGDQIRFLESRGMEIVYSYPLIGAHFVRFNPALSVPGMVAEFAAMPQVDWVQANDLGRRDQTLPNDTNFNNCYALHNTGQTVNGDPGTTDADMDCPAAWDLITDATNVRIAVVDSGCRISHQDLSANIWVNSGEIAGNGIDDDNNGKIDDVNGWDFLDGDNNPDDLDGHGTNVTGCIAMVGDNSLGGTGVCWDAQVMILKDGNTTPQVALSAAAIEYAAMNGAVSCNFSTGYGGGSYPALQAAVNVAETAGMIICVAAGNSTQNLDIVSDAPATYTNGNLLVVAASTNDDGLASFSNYGASNVDVAAAGQTVYTTSRFSNSSYSFVAGTSFSAPLTTGCVGLIRAYNVGATHQTVIAAILATADVKSAFTGKMVSNGRVNLAAALNMVGPGGGTGGTAPLPDPMTFAALPFMSTQSTAVMTATTATPGPVEYKFDLAIATGTGGTSSGWQIGTSYMDANLSPDAQFAWTVRARSASSLAETMPSASFGVWTPANVPGTIVVANPSNGGFDIASINPNGNPITTEFSVRVGSLFVGPAGWLQANEFFQARSLWNGTTVLGLDPLSVYVINARARNGQGLLTAFGQSGVTVTSLLGPAAVGDVNGNAGPAEQVFRINGSNGGAARIIVLPAGSPFSFEVQQPSTAALPSNFAVIAWWGIPNKAYEFEIPPFYGHGTLVFTPCDVNPGLPAFNIVSTFGSACGEMIAPTSLAPWYATNPGIPFALPDITLQGVVEETPGVYAATNAIVFRYQ